MAQTDTYANLVLLVEALFGATLGTTELARVQALVNRRAWLAYNETDFWENQLVIGEERAVNDSIMTVPYTGAVVDDTASTTPTNPYDASVDHFMRLHAKNPWNQLSSNEYMHQADSTGARLVGYKAAYGLSRAPTSTTAVSGTVSVATNTGTPWDAYVGGTIKLSGFDTDVHDINGIQTVEAVAITSTQTTVQYSITDTTTNIWTIDDAEAVLVPTVFCSYKKRLNGVTYGANDTTAIPQEWFEYIAHGVMADMLRADERWEAANQEENQAQFALQRELERIERTQTPQTLGNQIATHGTEQGRQSQTY